MPIAMPLHARAIFHIRAIIRLRHATDTLLSYATRFA